jgi:hypothetical protein
MTGWEAEGGPEELRFVLFGVPHVIKVQQQYLVCMQGLPPQRKLIHLAVIPRGRDGDGPDAPVEWVRRAGLFGLMAKAEGEVLEKRIRDWWTGSTEASQAPAPPGQG